MGIIAIALCTDVPESVPNEPVVLTVEQDLLLEEYEKLTDGQKQQFLTYMQSEFGDA